jgi:hypothetical protein
MRLVDFLVLLLRAHAETLKRLGAFFGEETLVAMLEDAGESFDDRRLAGLEPAKFATTSVASVIWIDTPTPRSNTNAYGELEGTVRELDLPEVLEFHLWAYPHYRAFIESAIDLNSRLAPGGTEPGTALIEEACASAEAWVKALPIPPSVAAAAYKAAQIPWLRFRTEALKKMGRRPLGAV